MFSMSLGRLNKFASLAILPGMVLVIMLFSRAARPAEDPAPPPSSGVLVTANLRSESLSFHDLRTGKSSVLALPGAPHEIVELNGRLYVTLGRADLVVEVDPLVPAVLRTMRLAGEPHGIAIHQGALAVSLDRRDAIVTIDPVSLAVTESRPTGDTPHVVVSDGTALFVIDSRANTVRRLDEPAAVQPAGELPEGLALVGDYVAVAAYGSGTLSLYDAATLGQVTTVDVGAGPVRVVALADGRVAVSRQGSPEVVVVAVPTGKVLERVEVPDRPDGLCLSPDGAQIAVAGNAGTSVVIYEVKNWEPTLTVEAGEGPGACLWLAGR